jgi:hypothetical protein
MCLPDRLSCEPVIGEGLALDGPTGQMVEELVFMPASVEAIGQLLEVAIEVFVADAAAVLPSRRYSCSGSSPECHATEHR